MSVRWGSDGRNFKKNYLNASDVQWRVSGQLRVIELPGILPEVGGRVEEQTNQQSGRISLRSIPSGWRGPHRPNPGSSTAPVEPCDACDKVELRVGHVHSD